MNLSKAFLLLFLNTQIVTLLAGECLEGQIKRKHCCVPVWHCKQGYYIKTCERDGNEDECKKCPHGTQNPFNSSSFDINKCYKSICKLDDSVAVSDNRCECDRSKGWFGENYLACQLNYEGCPVGKELTQKGICERCTNYHYKDWHGHGLCIKHFNCSLLQMDEIKGNSSQGNKCIKKGLKSKPTTPPSTTVTTASTSTTYSITKEATTKVETTPKTITTTGEFNLDLVGLTLAPTKVSQNLPVVGNRGPLDNVVSDRKLEGILIVVVTLLSVLLLVLLIGIMAYIKKRKSSRDVPISNRPALPLPNMQNEVFDPPICQTQRQTQPLLQPENPYLCMSNPNRCIYALPASLHLNNNYAMNQSPFFDNISTYGLNYAPPENRPMQTASSNSLGSQATLQSRNEHLYMTLPAVRPETRSATAATTPHHDSMNLENRNSTTTENFYEFP